ERFSVAAMRTRKTARTKFANNAMATADATSTTRRNTESRFNSPKSRPIISDVCNERMPLHASFTRVNEACSGIRSLQTSLMIGLLFGELKRLSVLRRVVLVASAVAIALLANFVRAVFLVRIAATENLSEVGRWHDIAGYTIIALVFVTTMALVYLLGRRKTKNSVAAGVSPANMREPQPAGLPLQSSAA